LPQETAAAGDETVLELALAVSPALVHAQKVIKAHETAVAGIADPGADAAYHNALHVFDEHGGWELEPKAKRVLARKIAYANRIRSFAACCGTHLFFDAAKDSDPIDVSYRVRPA